MTIQEQNKLIAEFMGGERILHPGQKYFSEKHYGYVCHDNHWWNENNLKYHSDWGWLMSVGKKIFEWLQATLKKRPPHTCIEGDLIECDITCAIREYNIEDAHKHIVRWIQWYNQQNSKHGTE